MDEHRPHNPLDPSQQDAVDVILNSKTMLDFVCATLCEGKPGEPYEISAHAQTGLYFILTTVVWSLEKAAEELSKDPGEESKEK